MQRIVWRRISSLTLLAMVMSILLLTSCANTGEDPPLERISLSKEACLDEDILAPRLPESLKNGRELKVLGGGTVSSGDFLISLWLICDPTLTSADPTSEHYSDFQHLAMLTAYEYLGKPLDQELKISTAINGEEQGTAIISAGTETEIHIGRGGGHFYQPFSTKALILPRALAAGEAVEFTLTVSTSSPLASAQLRAQFEETPDGYILHSAEIRKK